MSTAGAHTRLHPLEFEKLLNSFISVSVEENSKRKDATFFHSSFGGSIAGQPAISNRYKI